MKKTILFAIALFAFNPTFSQKKVINREIAQLNYDGYQLMLAENYKEALKLFNLAVEGDPEAFFIYQNRALCHISLGDTVNAILDFRKNLKFEPENTECLYNIGNICKKQRDTTNAIQYFKKSLQFAGSDFSEKKLIYMNQFLGNTYFEQNHFDSALVYFNYLKSADSLNTGIFIYSAVCNYKTNNSEGFCTDLERAFELGGAITCQFLKYYCDGCDKPRLSGKMSAPNSNVLDKRLEFLFQASTTQGESQKGFFIPEEIETRKVKVYFNSKWQVCPPETGLFYRESFWSIDNFFGGSFKDYFITGEILSEGTINKKNYEGLYKSYFKNGQTQTIGRFRNGIPVGKWVFFNENGKTDYEIEFQMDDFFTALS
ncbi:MAG: tetratricopeptide repeat protein [Draconibacterium sp.]|nr:tetratricopeptide repeat protein [Draconibacterium sp.]